MKSNTPTATEPLENEDVRMFMGEVGIRRMRKGNSDRAAIPLERMIHEGDLRIERAPHPGLDRITVRLPFLVTAWIVAWSAMLGPKPFARFRFWIVNILYRGYGFASAVFGPWLAKDSPQYRNRMIECGKCPSARLVLQRKAPFVKTYCGQCQCPRWPVSELALKNRFRNWTCPADRFPGKPEPAAWADIREQEAGLQSENQAAPRPARRGCGG